MKLLVRLLNFLLLAVNLQHCSYSSNFNTEKNTMDKEKKSTNRSTLYTDTSKVDIQMNNGRSITGRSYNIARQKGTERPWTSKFESSKEIGTYYWRSLRYALFRSDTKFESGVAAELLRAYQQGKDYLRSGTTLHGRTFRSKCGRCQITPGSCIWGWAPPTGLRYCINGCSAWFWKGKGRRKEIQRGTLQTIAYSTFRCAGCYNFTYGDFQSCQFAFCLQ